MEFIVPAEIATKDQTLCCFGTGILELRKRSGEIRSYQKED